MTEKRLDPDSLLKQVQQEEQQQQRGKLKIYLGAAPGVGKTYTMLQDAAAKREAGLDVVIGVVEAHGRQEIEALTQDFEILPPQKIDYRGKTLTEFDLDAALSRNPGLILIDEMAHANMPGLRHTKRWQDIKELLDRGVDVYTTLNVQHIESLNDDVARIIHAPIKETVPDSMLELADTIELVDLPPEDLLKRLQEGKVYFPGQAEIAKDHFFQKGNLIALREFALRVTAERVGAQVLLYRQGQGITHIWPTKEKILVCVGPGRESLTLIRAARQLATSLKAEWVAVYIDSAKHQSSATARNDAIKNLRLAEQLGATTRTLRGLDVAKEIIYFSREQNITLIMVWKHIRPRWQDLLFHQLADELVRQSGEIDVYLMTGKRDGNDAKKATPIKRKLPWLTYILSLGIVSATTGISLLLHPFLNASNLILIYLISLTIIALLGKKGPSILASLIGVLAFDFFFIVPLYSLSMPDKQYWLVLIALFIIPQVVNYLAIITKRQAESARFAEYQTATLHTLSRQLASTRGVNNLLKLGTKYIAEVFDSEILALLPENNHLAVRARSKTKHELNEKELSIAKWVYDLGQMAGAGTDTLPFSDAIYVPLLASQGAIGVLRVRPNTPENLFTPEQMNLLETCANQIALALEVDRLQEQAKNSELQTELDRSRSGLLQSVSQGLRAPLASIMVAANTEIERARQLTPSDIEKLGKQIHFESEQLNRLINNLLQITYLEAESIKLQKLTVSIKDIIRLVINASSKTLGKIPVHFYVADNIGDIPIDTTLMQEVFTNLIDNAAKFSPIGSAIDIYVTQEDHYLLISIEDQGPGIADDEREKLFEKFYRGRMLTTERGLGLGLAICQKIVAAHGGKIWAQNRENKGTAFRFTLPLQ
jgi:two-component system sensor histidine kinase KdpD